MNDVTQILEAIERGDGRAAEDLLPLVYDELRRLAAQRLAQEQPGQTLQATALVHEAFIRLVDVHRVQDWNSKGHFFAAAAEAMRRILVDRARHRTALKRGGGRNRLELDESNIAASECSDDLLALDDALEKLVETDQQSAELVKLRFFAGCTMNQAAEILGISPRKAHYVWHYARSWLRREMSGERGPVYE